MRPCFRPSLMGPASLAAVALLAAACGDFSAPPSTPVEEPSFAQGGRGQPVPDQYVVVFRREVSDAPGLARQLVSQHRGTLRFTYTHALKGFSARLPAAAAEALRRNPNVAYVEQDQEVFAFTDQTGATWGLDRVDQRDRPLNGIYS
ncbi:MAG: protease inhibitor I9 family protein, partial [Gemmatimonadales bacterium]